MTNGKNDMDGRDFCDWKTRYPKEAQVEYYLEGLFLLVLLLVSIVLIFFIWHGWLGNFFKIPTEKIGTFTKFSYYATAGMIGGITFDIKHLYRSVARAKWNQDRKLWRLLSPFIAMSVAFSIGTMIDSSLIVFPKETSGTTFVAIGFLSGYFADRAVGKMSEIAKVLFGENTEPTSEKKKVD